MFKREETVCYQIRTLNLLLKQHKNEELKDIKNRHLQFWTIGYLYNNSEKEIFQKNIESEFKISRATATKLLQSMEKNGFITRCEIETDKRMKKIILSDKATKMHIDFLNDIEKIEIALRQNLSDEELKCFFKCLNIMQQNLSQYKEKING